MFNPFRDGGGMWIIDFNSALELQAICNALTLDQFETGAWGGGVPGPQSGA
jgi:hypothetical protein